MLINQSSRILSNSSRYNLNEELNTISCHQMFVVLNSFIGFGQKIDVDISKSNQKIVGRKSFSFERSISTIIVLSMLLIRQT